jgi:hypothetical protein
MLDQIDYSNLSVIGGGGSAVTLSDGTYAIKIGKISHGDAAQMSHSGKFSVPVYFYSERMKIPEKILDVLYASKIPFYGTTTNAKRYTHGFAAVLICGLATPLVDNSTDLDVDMPKQECRKLYAMCERLAKRYKKALGYSWMDAHPYNVGRYQGRLVILDF